MKPCTRTWQVAAARDGRLRGKDLESAARHRETCAECTEEAHQLSALSKGLLELPVLTRDPMTAHRTRQQLLASFNQTVLEAPVNGRRARVALAFGAAALLALLWLSARRRTPPPALAVATSVVEVTAGPEAHWTEHLDTQLERIDLSAGFASFKVRPHTGRRVILSLPDGELEDLGTVFTVLVEGRETKRVTVSEGRVSLRVRGHAEQVVHAGESWEAEPAAPRVQPIELPPVTAPVSAHPAANSTPTSYARAKPVNALGSAAPAATESTTRASSKTDTAEASAEDEAYLHVVALLKAGKEEAARTEAKHYLLRFPNGFRRVEVLNIVTK